MTRVTFRLVEVFNPLPPLEEHSERISKELLFSYLSAEQRELFECHEYFYVDTQKGFFALTCTGFTAFRISKTGKVLSMHQAGPHSLPAYDRILAQLLLLKTDPSEFLHVACRYPYTQSPHIYSYATRYLEDQYPGLASGEHFPYKPSRWERFINWTERKEKNDPRRNA